MIEPLSWAADKLGVGDPRNELVAELGEKAEAGYLEVG
jgi:hypothetical protein